MKRRDFIRTSLGIAAGSIFIPGTATTLFGAPETQANRKGLAAVIGGEPGPMFDKGIAALGGIRKFVKPNQTVVVKPNIGWDTEPERGANTDPRLVNRIVARCFDAGAKKVYVFDHTVDVWQRCYENSGIEHAVKKAGGKMVPGNHNRHYQKVKIPRAKKLKEAYAHELFLESDVFINVPILKNHGSTKLTIGMKNLMGVVWDRGWWHSHNLHQCIADFTTLRIPDLTVIDAYRVMKKHGPRGVSIDDTILTKAQIISTDPVAADAAAAKIFGMEPEKVPYIRLANDMGIGSIDLTRLDVKRIKLS